MYVGQVVELALTDKLFATPKHLYTEADVGCSQARPAAPVAENRAHR